MTGPTHVLIGIASTIAIVKVFHIAPDAIGVLAVFIGSLAPDIDGDGSITRPGTILRRFISWRVARVLDGFGQTLSGLIRLIAGHRGFFHWPVLGVTMMLVGMLYHHPLIFWFGWGYLGHLMADTCTMQGIPWLAPLWNKKWSLSLLKTGSLKEGIFFVVLLGVVVYWGVELLPLHTQEAIKGILDSFL